MLGGIHFLLNRQLRICLSAVAWMEVERWCVLDVVYVYVRVDFEKWDYFLGFDVGAEKKSPGLEGMVRKKTESWTKTTLAACLCWDWSKLEVIIEVIIFKIQLETETCCLLKRIKDQHSLVFSWATCGQEAPTGNEEKIDFLSEAVSATSNVGSWKLSSLSSALF